MDRKTIKIFGLCCLILAGMAIGCRRHPSPGVDAPASFTDTRWLQGYRKTLEGGTIAYSSPQPDVTSALLVRSLDSRDFIAWETAPLPSRFPEEFAVYVWIFGMDVDAAPRSYDLLVNGVRRFRFSNPRDSLTRDWETPGEGGARLRFRVTMVDRHGDVFGYAAMKIPVSMLRTGGPQQLKVVGETAGSRVWYMTFQSPAEERASGAVVALWSHSSAVPRERVYPRCGDVPSRD